ncbi:MAG: rhodanese-related sulfurtransferase [Chitinophagaceae bacterium]|nr:MAG: rhodanese-related sulfurtransferase [Chitinophagaceae bacterium]
MAVLHNRVSNEELKQRMLAETEPRTTISFYRYFPIPDLQAFRDEWYQQLTTLRVFGRIYVAAEGVNAQVSVPQSRFAALRDYLYNHEALDGIRLNVAVDDDGKSFWVLRVKVREKIVADGIADPAFDMSNRGKYVSAEEFNAMTEDPETVVVDMRNHYEFEVGHFEKAIEVPSDAFRDQLPMAVDMLEADKDKKIIMYCTGGIRCEKASAYMLHRGFRNVYHLEGGIIHYANQVREKGLPNKFHGKNFVFDNRLGERITDEIIAKCHQCGAPADTHVNCVNESCHLLFIQCDTCKANYEHCCSRECQDFIHLPAEVQKEKRKGVEKGRNVFSKGRHGLRPKLSDLGRTL